MPRIQILRPALSALLLFATPASLLAQRPQHGATLSQALAAALNGNPDVLLSGALVDSARAERTIALEFPNPIASGVPNSPYQYALAIPLDVTPRRFLRTKSAALGERASQSDLRDVQRQTRLAVVHAFYDALLADQQRAAALARRQAVVQILAADSARYHSGDIAEHTIGRSEIELARADADVARAGLDVEHARIVLQGLMGVEHPDTAFAALGSLDYRPLRLPDDDLVAAARSHRADYQAATERVEQSRTSERAASALLFPTPELTYVRQYSAPFDNGHYYSLGLGFELPSINLYRGERERAAAGASASRIGERRLNAQIEREVTLALSDFRVQRSLVESYESGVLDKTEVMLSAEQYAYSRGAASLLEVLDALRAQQDVQNEYAAALHDYWVSAYTVSAAVGVELFDCSNPTGACSINGSVRSP